MSKGAVCSATFPYSLHLKTEYKRDRSQVYVFSNGAMQYQELNPVRGFVSCVTTVLHFGLEKNNVDSVGSYER